MMLPWRIWASILGAVCSAMGINAISNATGLLAGRFHVSLSELSPATSFYLLAEIAALPLVPIAIRRLGGQRLLTLALSGFLLASILCMLAPSLPALLASRALQGFFGGTLLILPGILIKLEVAPPKQAFALTVFSFAAGFAPIIGPLLTSLMTVETVHVLFGIMVALTALALSITPRVTEPLPESTPLPINDIVAVLFCCSGLVAVVWGVEQSQIWGGWQVPQTQLFIITGVGAILLAVIHQWGKPKALLPVYLFRNAHYAGLLISGLLVGVIIYGFIYLVPYYLIRVHQAGVSELFHIALYVAVPQLAFLPITLYLRNRMPAYAMACTGAALAAFSVWQLTGLGVDFGGQAWALPQGLRAIAIPMIALPLSLLLLTTATKEDAPAINAMYGLCRTLGGVIGISGLTVYTDSRQSHYEQIIMMNPGSADVPAQSVTQHSWLYAFNDTFTLVTFLVLAMLLYFLLSALSQRKLRKTD